MCSSKPDMPAQPKTDKQLFEIVRPVQEEVPPWSIWRHRKNRKNYVILCIALEEASLKPIVVYRVNNFGSVPWARPAHEFLDGRFVRLDEGQPTPFVDQETGD